MLGFGFWLGPGLGLDSAGACMPPGLLAANSTMETPPFQRISVCTRLGLGIGIGIGVGLGIGLGLGLGIGVGLGIGLGIGLGSFYSSVPGSASVRICCCASRPC